MRRHSNNNNLNWTSIHDNYIISCDLPIRHHHTRNRKLWHIYASDKVQLILLAKVFKGIGKAGGWAAGPRHLV